MDPRARYSLNPAAKEHRLQKLKKRLEAATPKTRKRPARRPAPQPEPAGLKGWVIVLAIVAFCSVMWWVKRKAKGG